MIPNPQDSFDFLLNQIKKLASLALKEKRTNNKLYDNEGTRELLNEINDMVNRLNNNGYL